MSQVLGISEGLHWRFSKTVFARVRAALIVFIDPLVHIHLQLIQAAVELLSKGYAVELILHRPVEPLTDAVFAGVAPSSGNGQCLRPPNTTGIRDARDGRSIPSPDP